MPEILICLLLTGIFFGALAARRELRLLRKQLRDLAARAERVPTASELDTLRKMRAEITKQVVSEKRKQDEWSL